MADKRMTLQEMIAEVKDGDTVGMGGGWGQRRPMAAVRALARSSAKDLRLVAWGGPDVGILCAAGKLKHVSYGFVSLEAVPLEPYFRKARELGLIEAFEVDEGMFRWGLYAAALRLPSLPTRAGIGSDVVTYGVETGQLKVMSDPYTGERLCAMPALPTDVAFIHVNYADKEGNCQILANDPIFDNWYCMGAKKAFVTCEKIIPTEEFHEHGCIHTMHVLRFAVAGVCEVPYGAHPTVCYPDYRQDYGHLLE